VFTIGFLPIKGIEDYVNNFAKRLNAVQDTFLFKVYHPINQTNKLVSTDEIEDEDAFQTLRPLKEDHNLSAQDCLIAFTIAVLGTPQENLTNLFYSGSGDNIFIISLKFLQWGIIEGKLTQELKFHALSHLLIGILLETYTNLTSHSETRGCLMDFCNSLIDFNAMLARRYFLCNNCKDSLKGPPSELFKKLLSELRSEKSYSKSILVIGGYNRNSENKLEKIKNKLNDLGYQAFLVRGVPDSHHGSRERKFVNLASQSHFIVCENSFASGHIDELKICIGNEFVTCILQESDHKATSLQIHYPYLYNFVEIFCYGGVRKSTNHHICRHTTEDLESAIDKASQWAEEFWNKYEDVLDEIYKVHGEVKTIRELIGRF
jgi:hypothetical protein